MVDSNLQRECIKPSEKGFAYKLHGLTENLGTDTDLYRLYNTNIHLKISDKKNLKK